MSWIRSLIPGAITVASLSACCVAVPLWAVYGRPSEYGWKLNLLFYGVTGVVTFMFVQVEWYRMRRTTSFRLVWESFAAVFGGAAAYFTAMHILFGGEPTPELIHKEALYRGVSISLASVMYMVMDYDFPKYVDRPFGIETTQAEYVNAALIEAVSLNTLCAMLCSGVCVALQLPHWTLFACIGWWKAGEILTATVPTMLRPRCTFRRGHLIRTLGAAVAAGFLAYKGEIAFAAAVAIVSFTGNFAMPNGTFRYRAIR